MQKVTQVYTLQGLCYYATFIVIFVHTSSTYEYKIDVISGTFIICVPGEIGCKLFSCISGSINYNSSKEILLGIHSLRTFFRRLLIHLALIYWLATCIYAAKLSPQGIAPVAAGLGMSLFFIPYTNEYGLMRPVLGVGWSLNFEMFFYALFGMSLLVAKQFRAFCLFFVLTVLLTLRAYGWLAQGHGFLFDCLYQLADYYLLYFLAGLLVGVLREKLIATKHVLSLSFTTALLGCSGILALYLTLHISGLIPKVTGEAAMAVVCILCVGISVLEFRPSNHAGDGFITRNTGLAGDASL